MSQTTADPALTGIIINLLMTGTGLLFLWLMSRTMARLDADVAAARLAADQAGRELQAYKLEAAEKYASIAYLRDVEKRLTEHLVRIEEKIDRGRSVAAAE